MPARKRPGKTTIWVSDETRDILESLKVDPGQSYDSVIAEIIARARRAKRHSGA